VRVQVGCGVRGTAIRDQDEIVMIGAVMHFGMR
jgi:predicted lipoprotein